MDIARALTFTFDDEDWVTKVLIRVIISIIPIVNFAVFGWIVDLIRNMLDGVEHPMPDWDDFGDKFMSGLLYFIAVIVYNIPSIIVACILGVVAGALGSNRSLSGLAFAVQCCIWLFALIYGIAVGFILFVGIIRFSRQRELGVFFQFAENLAIARDNLSTVLMLIVYAVIAGVLFALIGWIPCIGWLAALILAPNVLGHLMGQAAIEIMGKRKVGAA